MLTLVFLETGCHFVAQAGEQRHDCGLLQSQTTEFKDCLEGMGTVAHTCNPALWEADGGQITWSGVQHQPGQHGETLSLLKP